MKSTIDISRGKEKRRRALITLIQQRGGDTMIIKDNDREYDISRLNEYSELTLGIIKRLIYSRYVSIRNLLNSSRCNKMTSKVLKDKLSSEEEIKRVSNVFGYSKDEILFYVNYTISNFPMVR